MHKRNANILALNNVMITAITSLYNIEESIEVFLC